MKLLIVNADDFGVTFGVNRAIIEAHSAGTVSSASLMANMPALSDAVCLAKANKALGVGIHLTLASGNSVLPKHIISSLVDRNGRFLSRRALVTGLITKRVSLSEIDRELRAQIDVILKSGIVPDHMDGDKHVHILPGIRQIVVSLAGEFGFPLRIPNERITLSDSPYSLFSKKSILAITALLYRKRMALATTKLCDEKKVKYNEKFISIFGLVPRRMPETQHFSMLLDRITDGVTEMMVHPGYHDQQLEAFYGERYLSMERELELACLVDPLFKEAVKKNRITIGTYKSVQGSP